MGVENYRSWLKGYGEGRRKGRLGNAKKCERVKGKEGSEIESGTGTSVEKFSKVCRCLRQPCNFRIQRQSSRKSANVPSARQKISPVERAESHQPAFAEKTYSRPANPRHARRIQDVKRPTKGLGGRLAGSTQPWLCSKVLEARKQHPIRCIHKIQGLMV